MFTKSYINILK